MTTLVGVPAAPTGLKAVAVLATGTDAVELTWTAPSPGAAPITGYRIESFADHDSDAATPNTWGEIVADTESLGTDGAIGGGDDADNAGPGVQTHYAVDAVAGENQYRVSAINRLGTGLVSAVVKVTPPVAGAQPGAPTGVAATADGHSEINLVWVAPANAGSTAITGYKIEYSEDGDLPWMDVANVGNVLRYNNTGLAPETTRFYRVSAINSVGGGPVSATPDVTISGTETYNTVLTDHVATTEAGPAFSVAGPGEVRYSENGTEAVGTYTASGLNAANARWMLEGDDASDFRLSTSTGASTMLMFSSSPNYEMPMDADTDNTYMVTVKASHGTGNAMVMDAQDVMVMVINMEDDGMVTFWRDDADATTAEIVLGDELTAAVMDPDGNPGDTPPIAADTVITAATWQWAMHAGGSMPADDSTGWTDITGATNAAYTVAAADVGMYLRATAMYDDGHGTGKMAMEMTAGAVVAEATPMTPIGERYDTDKSGRIDKDELANAVYDYNINGTISKSDLADLIYNYEVGG